MAEQPTLPPNKIAFVIDNQVVDVLHTDDRLAAILLSNPSIIDAGSAYEGKEVGFHIVGWTYNKKSNTFETPSVETAVKPED